MTYTNTNTLMPITATSRSSHLKCQNIKSINEKSINKVLIYGTVRQVTCQRHISITVHCLTYLHANQTSFSIYLDSPVYCLLLCFAKSTRTFL